MNTMERVNEVYQKWAKKWLEHLEENKLVLLLENEGVNTYLSNFHFNDIEIKDLEFKGQNLPQIKTIDNKRGYIARTLNGEGRERWAAIQYFHIGKAQVTEEIIIRADMDKPLFHVFESFQWAQMYKDVISCYGE